MAGRIRTLKPEWLDDEKLASMSDEARLLSVALILMADDHGNGRANHLLLASRAWPYGGAEAVAKVSRALRELSANSDGASEPDSYVVLYTHKKQQYFSIRNWKKHQRIDRPSRPQVPTPNDADASRAAQKQVSLADDSRGTREALAPDLDLDLEGKGEDRDTRETREVADQPASAANTEPLLILHKLAEKRGGWIGNLRASDRVRRSAEGLIALAKTTADAKGAEWDRVLDLVLRRWFREKPDRVNLPNWPMRAAEDWQATVALVDEHRDYETDELDEAAQ